MAAADIVALVASGRATSRAEVVRVLGLAPSTVSARVQSLIDAGVLVEAGEGESRGGRRPRMLRLADQQDVSLVADLGAHHARIALIGPDGRRIAARSFVVDVDQGPEKVLEQVAGALTELHRASGPQRGISMVGIGLPGPVDVVSGTVQGASRMRGWNGFEVRRWLEQHFGVPAILENDTHLLAVGELAARNDLTDFILVKAGTGIGGAIVSDGHLRRGARGAAGDVSHVRVKAAVDRPCACGNHGCLETIAAGAALCADLTADGIEVGSTAELIKLASEANPAVITRLRQAGRYLGEVLAALVNFQNPQAVVLAGLLSTSDAFVSAARAILYDRCLPLATRHLEIARTVTGPDGGLAGLAALTTPPSARRAALTEEIA